MPDILLDHFYTIDTQKQEGDTISAQATFNAAHPIFGGHFLGMPVVPGVCQMQMLDEILSHAFHLPFTLSAAASIKFLSVIDPVKHPSVNISITATKKEDDTYAVSAQYLWEEKVFFKFKGTYIAG